MKQDFKHLIKYLKAIKPEEMEKALSRLIEMKIIGKREYKALLKEVINGQIKNN